MKLTRRTSNILIVIGVFLLLSWGTRFFTFLAQLNEGTLVAPGVHFSLIAINAVIAAYLIYLGLKGRRSTSGTA